MKRFLLFLLLLTCTVTFLACSTEDDDPDNGGTNTGTVSDGIPTGTWIMSTIADTHGVVETIPDENKVIVRFFDSTVVMWEYDDSDSTISSDTMSFVFNATADTMLIDGVYPIALKAVGQTLVETGTVAIVTYIPYSGDIPHANWPVPVVYDVPDELLNKTWAMISFHQREYANGVQFDSSIMDMDPSADSYLYAQLFEIIDSGLLQMMNVPDVSTYLTDTMDLMMRSEDTIMIDDGYYTYTLVGDTLRFAGGNIYSDTTEIDTITLVRYTGPMPPASWLTGAAPSPLIGSWLGNIVMGSDITTLNLDFEVTGEYTFAISSNSIPMETEYGDWEDSTTFVVLISDMGDTSDVTYSISNDSLYLMEGTVDEIMLIKQ